MVTTFNSRTLFKVDNNSLHPEEIDCASVLTDPLHGSFVLIFFEWCLESTGSFLIRLYLGRVALLDILEMPVLFQSGKVDAELLENASVIAVYKRMHISKIYVSTDK